MILPGECLELGFGKINADLVVILCVKYMQKNGTSKKSEVLSFQPLPYMIPRSSFVLPED